MEGSCEGVLDRLIEGAVDTFEDAGNDEETCELFNRCLNSSSVGNAGLSLEAALPGGGAVVLVFVLSTPDCFMDSLVL